MIERCRSKHFVDEVFGKLQDELTLAGYGAMLWIALTVATVCLLSGCASLPTPSSDWNERPRIDTSNTSWSGVLVQPAAEHRGSSGVQLVPYGLDALSARLALADTAERSLDV